METKVFLDLNVPFHYCSKGRHEQFFYFLEQHPNLGLISRKSFEILGKFLKKEGCIHYKEALDEYERLPTYLDVRNFSHLELEENFVDVRKFLFDIIQENKKSLPINMGLVSSRYKRLAYEINTRQPSLGNDERNNLKQKVFMEVPEPGDAMLIAQAISVPAEHKFIASTDKHLIEQTISRAIEEKYKIKSGFPEKILGKCEHLLKEKAIL
jgi:hypothetical protein